MKKLMIFCLILSTMVLGSCKKFLEEYSQDEMRPSNADELASLMYSDAYPYNRGMDTFDLLTDDIQSNGLASTSAGPVPAYVTPLANGTPMFTFDPTMFNINNVIPAGANAYEIYYGKIKGCNVVMDQLDNVTGTQQAKNAIIAQCLFLRSYYLFKLVTTYSKPYSAPGVNPETALGVPLILSSQVRDGGIARPTLKQTYDQIEKDLIQSADLLKANYTPPTPFRVGHVAAYAMLCRFYLYRGLESDLDKVINYANLVLAERNTLTALTTFFTTGNALSGRGIFDSGNTEVLWVYGGNPRTDVTYFPTPVSGSTPPFAVSSALASTYEPGTSTSNLGDLRSQMYFVSFSGIPYSSSKSTNLATYGTKGFRLAEVYLNRAEAYIKRFLKNGDVADRSQALSDLNYLRQNRYDTRNTAYVPVNITDGAALFTFYQQERRRELALEDNHRWQDIRRFGLSVTHSYTGGDGVTTVYTLPSNSPLYALPIPYNALANNLDLIQNEL